ncbi:MAG: Gldg family protein [Candidatus Lernaella stagnicola]|nr:Gldg family protein [Candidatus Lernaella stagnicola]
MKTFARIWFWEGLVLVVFAGLSLLFLNFEAVYELLFPLVMGGLGLLGLTIALVIHVANWSKHKEDQLERESGTMLKFGTNAVVYTVVFLGILVFANVIVAGRSKKFDLTSAHVNTLSDQSATVLENIPPGGQIELVGFFKAGESAPFEKLAEKYTDVSDRVVSQVIDPDLHPEAVARYAITERGAVAVTCDRPELSEQEKFAQPACTGQTNVTLDITEQGLTSAVMKVSAPQGGAVYFLEGHGEVPLDGNEKRGFALIKKRLENENLTLKPLLLLTAGAVPADAGLVVVAGPTKKLPENEVQILKQYADGGGRLIIMADPMTETGLEGLLAEYGISLMDNVIVDRQVKLFEGSVLGLDPVVLDYGVHEITKKFGENPTIFHEARSLKIAAPKGVIVEPFLSSGTQSWGETDFAFYDNADDQPVLRDGEDTRGPLVLGATATRKIGEGDAAKTAKLVVIGDADFAGNLYVAQGFNADLFFNAINWATGQEAYISIRANTFAPDVFTLTQKDTALIFFASVFLLPQLVVMFGIGVAIFRRRE